MKKRILSILLCLCMVLTLFPVTIFADGEASYPVVNIQVRQDGALHSGLTLEYRSTNVEGLTYTFKETSTGIYQYNGVKPGSYDVYVDNKKLSNNTFNPGSIEITYYMYLYTVTFDANGQEFTEETAPASQLCWNTLSGSNKMVTRPADPAAKDSDYRFVGWTVGPEKDSGAFDFATSISSKTVIYAQWERNTDDNTFPVTAERATITGSSSATRGEDYHATLVPVNGYELPFRETSSEYTTRTHIKIDGQMLNTANYTLNLSTGELTIPGQYITGRVEIVTVPRQNPFIMHFNANGGTGTQEGEGAKVYDSYGGYEYAHGYSPMGYYSLPSCTFTPPEKKQFSHWNFGPNSSDVYKPGDTFYVYNDRTFYAVWKDKPEENYTVSYNLTGCDFSGSTNASNNSDYTTVITPKDGYTAPLTLVSVQVGGSTLDSSEYLTAQDGETGALTLTIPANKITGNIIITASAPPAHTHCVCGGNTDVGDHTTHTDVTWTGVSSLSEITGTGSYYLTDDILMDSNLNITGTVDLCLNGHRIYTQTGVPYGTVKIQTGAALNVCDCSENGSGLITTCRGEYAIENSGTLNLYSGSVERSSDDNGAAVKVNAGAVFNMYGGKIGGNAKAILAYGTVHASGGTVSAKRQAMEVYAGSEVTVSGNATLSVTGTGYSTIAVYGGVVNICGGKVTNDSSAAVYAPSGESTLNISGGEISTAPSARTDTIRLNSDSVEVTVTGGSITNGYASAATNTEGNRYGWAIDVYKVKSLTISGAPVINRIYLADSYRITVGEDGLTNETPIEIHCAKCPAPVTGANDTDYSSKFTPRSSFYAIINAEDNVVLFTKAATVTYTDGVDGEEIFPDQTHSTYLGQPTPAFNGTPQRTGYVFGGWYTDGDCTDGNEYDFDTPVTKNITLYAKWSPHTHSWATAWSKNETHHWHECTADGCDVTNDADKNGYAEHTYDQEIATADYKATDATCTAKATYYKSCICGAKGTETFENGEFDASNHTFGDWQHNRLYHWKVCATCGEKVDKARHNYGTDRVCDTCGYVKPRTNNSTTPSQPTDTTTKSADTGDMGIALYAGMAILSLTGGAWVVNKKRKGK